MFVIIISQSCYGYKRGIFSKTTPCGPKNRNLWNQPGSHLEKMIAKKVESSRLSVCGAAWDGPTGSRGGAKVLCPCCRQVLWTEPADAASEWERDSRAAKAPMAHRRLSRGPTTDQRPQSSSSNNNCAPPTLQRCALSFNLSCKPLLLPGVE